MPYAATGIYTPPTGAESAVPSQVIRSATWNTIFVDLAEALSALRGLRTIAVAGSATIVAADNMVVVTANVPTLSLPSCATKLGPVTIIGGASTIFSSASCVLVGAGAETINGVATRTLTTAFQAITLIPLASGGYLVG